MNDFVKKLASTVGKARSSGILAVVSADLKVEQDALGAFIEVEAGGSGFDKKGRLKILFEKHHFYKHVDKALRDKAVKDGLARQKWISPKNGGYNDQKNSDDKWAILERAADLDEEAALKSASLGAGQVMGSHAEWLGFPTVQIMWERNAHSEDEQIQTMAYFIRRAGLIDEMQKLDWRGLAKGYNGSGQVDVYAPRLKAAYNKLKKIPDEPMPSTTMLTPVADAEEKPEGPVGPMSRGDEGDDVKILQRALNERGAKCIIDGEFGKGTESEVRKFQKSVGLTPDGCVGPDTRKALGLIA